MMETKEKAMKIINKDSDWYDGSVKNLIVTFQVSSIVLIVILVAVLIVNNAIIEFIPIGEWERIVAVVIIFFFGFCAAFATGAGMVNDHIVERERLKKIKEAHSEKVQPAHD